jgi:hypothetical protein
MRRSDETPLDPDVAAGLEAIDAALEGKMVDPRSAGLAELAVLLRNDRPAIDRDFARRLDQAASRRFVPLAERGSARPGTAERTRRRRLWLWTPAAGLAVSLAVAVAIVAGGGAGSGGRAFSVARPKAPVFGAGHSRLPLSRSVLQSASGTAVWDAPGFPVPAPAFAGAATALRPPSAGRQVVQGGQLSLSTGPRLVDQVAQEVFDVVGQEHGYVNSSTVTASGGPGGYGQFQLSIPSSALSQTMALLSSLPHARVVSRTDTTQDVTGSYQADQRRLADARTLRASLLKQLAGATTPGQIDSITARIHDAESAITAGEATLRSLQHQISYSQVTVALNAGASVAPASRGSGQFTLGQAAHVAGRVLTVAAGVVLIGLAALVPVGLLAGLAWWAGIRVRRRRRLQALDLV